MFTQTLTPNLLQNIYYLLLLRVSATEHGHLQAATKFLGYMTYIALSTSKKFCSSLNMATFCGETCLYLFSWRYNPLWLYFHSPVAGFSLLVFEVS